MACSAVALVGSIGYPSVCWMASSAVVLVGIIGYPSVCWMACSAVVLVGIIGYPSVCCMASSAVVLVGSIGDPLVCCMACSAVVYLAGSIGGSSLFSWTSMSLVTLLASEGRDLFVVAESSQLLFGLGGKGGGQTFLLSAGGACISEPSLLSSMSWLDFVSSLLPRFLSLIIWALFDARPGSLPLKALCLIPSGAESKDELLLLFMATTSS